MKKVKLNKILKNGKAIFLAYDQGLEHGPTDFNDKITLNNHCHKLFFRFRLL